jgi:hypothetical protein
VVRTLPAPGAHCNEVTRCRSSVQHLCHTVCMLVAVQARLHTCGPWYRSCRERVAAAAAGPIQGQALPQTVSGAAKSVLRHPAAVPVVQHSTLSGYSSLQQRTQKSLMQRAHEQEWFGTHSCTPATLNAGAALGAGYTT